MYSDEQAAALYDVLNPWGPSDDFYLALVMRAPSVLDVGCGTGALLRRARQAGHAGRLCGLDPDPAMLGVARRRADVEWVAGTAASMAFGGEFDLAVMTGHAFQALLGDDEVRASLAAVRWALAAGRPGQPGDHHRRPIGWAGDGGTGPGPARRPARLRLLGAEPGAQPAPAAGQGVGGLRRPGPGPPRRGRPPLPVG